MLCILDKDDSHKAALPGCGGPSVQHLLNTDSPLVLSVQRSVPLQPAHEACCSSVLVDASYVCLCRIEFQISFSSVSTEL